MKRIIALLATAAALWTSAVAGTTPAKASSAGEATSYMTVMTQTLPLPTAGAFPGKLTLTVSSDGIVNGWYNPDYEGSVVSVTGGKTGDQLWLDIGERGAVRVTATIQKDGSIVGSATGLDVYGSTPSDVPATFSFVATPQAAGSISY